VGSDSVFSSTTPADKGPIDIPASTSELTLGRDGSDGYLALPRSDCVAPHLAVSVESTEQKLASLLMDFTACLEAIAQISASRV
jgi:hypothetical protein